jgi:hypothetical protein
VHSFPLGHVGAKQGLLGGGPIKLSGPGVRTPEAVITRDLAHYRANSLLDR